MSRTANACICAILCMVLLGPGPLGAQTEKTRDTRNVSGKWTMTLEGGAHGVQTMGLRLEHKGGTVTGRVETPPHGDLAVQGEFKEGTLELSTTGAAGLSNMPSGR